MKYLAIETSSPRLSLALGNESKVLASHTGSEHWRHAESLFEGIEKLLRRTKWPIQSLTGVAVSVGPGSFTGIRIGLAAARALGQSLRIPVVGVSSLETMAAGATTKAVFLSPQIDALRGQVFTALFQRTSSRSLRRVVSESMVVPQEWIKLVRQKCQALLAGKVPGTFDQSLWISPLQGCYPDARVLLDLARPRLVKAGPESYKSVLPLYIRKAAAQERKK